MESMLSKYHMSVLRVGVCKTSHPCISRRCLLNIAFVHFEAMFAKYCMEVANRGSIFTKYGIREAIFSKHRCVS